MPRSPCPSPVNVAEIVTKGPSAGSKAALTVLSVVIVKLQVLVPHAVALRVPAEKTPGGEGPPAGAFATSVTPLPAAIGTEHDVDAGLLQRTPPGTTPTVPAPGPAS